MQSGCMPFRLQKLHAIRPLLPHRFSPGCMQVLKLRKLRRLEQESGLQMGPVAVMPAASLEASWYGSRARGKVRSPLITTDCVRQGEAATGQPCLEAVDHR